MKGKVRDSSQNKFDKAASHYKECLLNLQPRVAPSLSRALAFANRSIRLEMPSGSGTSGAKEMKKRPSSINSILQPWKGFRLMTNVVKYI
jgi:hypothetical protein